jgi:hypothetical protein
MGTPKYVVAGDPIPPEFTSAAGINRLLDRIAALTAAIEPLLDHPLVSGMDGDSCVWCSAIDDADHEANCPVLRKDELLGRTSTTTENTLS